MCFPCEVSFDIASNWSIYGQILAFLPPDHTFWPFLGNLIVTVRPTVRSPPQANCFLPLVFFLATFAGSCFSLGQHIRPPPGHPILAKSCMDPPGYFLATSWPPGNLPNAYCMTIGSRFCLLAISCPFLNP
jgi:hypothetical protein